MRVLITGGSGMIGANLARRLVQNGAQVTIIARGSTAPVRLFDEPTIRIETANCTDADSVRDIFARCEPDTVFHLASSSFNPPTISPREHVDSNVIGALSVLDAARQHPVGRVVLTGSAAEYGGGNALSELAPRRPATIYGASKYCASVLAETFARVHGVPTVNLCLFTPYGPWERPTRLIPYTILAALDNAAIHITSGQQQRDFVYIDDVVDALLLAATAPIAVGETVNIASGRGTPVLETVKTILELMQSTAKIEAGAAEVRADEIQLMSGDNAKAQALLGWSPKFDLRSGLERTIAWFTHNTALALTLT